MELEVAVRRMVVLLVEDEPLVAGPFKDALTDLGYEVIWADSVEVGLGVLAEQRVDVAVLDVQLGADYSYPIADVLHRAGIPFMFVSGVSRGSVPPEHQTRPFLPKPFRIMEVHRSLCALAG
ncbi:response regulator [Stenotrophomonas maltophilia]|nr:response regulator [Stenotrophomonas maltophilia]